MGEINFANFSGLLSRDIAVVIGPLLQDPPPLPSAPPSLVGAIEKRRREYLTGRHYAALALQALACPTTVVGRNPDRSPIWPTGHCGSISHTDTLCGAIAARCDTVSSLGLDIEQSASVTPELVDMICSAKDDAGGYDPTVVFCAKEAFYKAWHPLARTFLDFHDVRISVLDSSTLRADVVSPGKKAVMPEISSAVGRFAQQSSHVLAAFAF